MKVVCFRGLTLLLIVCLLSGCATRTIHFSSNPEGALVQAGGASCTTPCELNVPVETQSALFILSAGASKEIPIDNLTSRTAATRYALGRTGEYSSGSLAVPLIIGGGALLLLACFLDAPSCFTGGEISMPSRYQEAIAVAGFAGLAAGGTLYLFADELDADATELRPEVRASFVQTPLLPPQELILPVTRKNVDGTLQLFFDEEKKKE